MPKSSAEVHREFVHQILKNEVDGQEERQDDQREDGEEEEVNGVVEEIKQTQQRSHETVKMGVMSADPNLSHACACDII